MDKFPSRILYQGAIVVGHNCQIAFASDGFCLVDRDVFLVINPNLTRENLKDALDWRDFYLERCFSHGTQKQKDRKRHLVTGFLEQIRSNPDLFLDTLKEWKQKNEMQSPEKTLAGKIEAAEMNGATIEALDKIAPLEARNAAKASWPSKDPIGNVPELPITHLIPTHLQEHFTKLAPEAQTILQYMPHIYCIGYRYEYFHGISPAELSKPRGLFGSTKLWYGGTEDLKAKDYIPKDTAIYYAIELFNFGFTTFFEETKHVIHKYTGFCRKDWDTAIEKDLENANSNCLKFILQYGSKDSATIDYYRAKGRMGAEALVELEFAFEKLQKTENLSVDEGIKRIIAEMPECGKLFAEYKVKETMLARAYQNKEFARAEDIRSGIIKPDISPFFPKAQSLSGVRQHGGHIQVQNWDDPR